MNSKVEKTIYGESVTAQPVYKGGNRPAYWECTINEHVQPKRFDSAQAVFRFAEKRRHHHR